MRPLAYHITWGTYGTRLHGDRRGTVDRSHNQLCSPILDFDALRWEHENARLKFRPVMLTIEQRRFLEQILPTVCQRGHWNFLTCAARPDHVHLLVQSEVDPETIRRLAKRWAGMEMFKRFNRNPEQTWWAECGSIRWIGDRPYLDHATDYVVRQRADYKPSVPSPSMHDEMEMDFDLLVD